jgi:hypothetical protein
MELFRKPPYPLTASYDVPDANFGYIVILKDKERNEVLDMVALSSNSSYKILYQVPDSIALYDDFYSFEVYEDQGDQLGEIVVEDNLEIVRPYVDPEKLGSTATEISEYIQYEKIARAVIDSITGGFYYNKYIMQVSGLGADYIPIWNRARKILKVYENSVLVYDINNTETGPALGDWNYFITRDKTSITKESVAPIIDFNRSEQKQTNLRIAESDSYTLFDTADSGVVFTVSSGSLFPEGYDYTFELEQGYKVVPNDIGDATLMLIEDIKCGKLDYFKRYITSYSTDQFKIQIDKSSFDGTGNILVDKILSKYVNDMGKPGVL